MKIQDKASRLAVSNISMKINGMEIVVPSDYTILKAAKTANIDIPTLCYLEEINEIGSCRICLVEIKGMEKLQAACVHSVAEGMEVLTNTTAIREARQVNLELILSDHDRECLSCIRNGNCELQQLCSKLSVEGSRFVGERNQYVPDTKSLAITRNNNKCVLCKRCVSICEKQDVHVLEPIGKGFKTEIGCSCHRSLADVPCPNCGQCIVACPVGAMTEKSSIDKVWEALQKPGLRVVAQPAPAVRVTLGEEFGMPIGTRVTGKLAAALRRLGFDSVFDTNTGADFTVMEEVTELMIRLEKNEKLPLITSCSPGWVKYCEHKYPEFLDNLSSAKSPQAMFGALVKTYYAQKEGIDPGQIFVTSVMPCTAKKFEVTRDHFVSGYPDVDEIVTVREVAKMIKESGIDFINLPDEGFDEPLGISSGAGAIFGTSGGVTEAALRTLCELMTGEDLPDVNFMEVRNTTGIKEVQVKIGHRVINAAVVHGLGNAKKILDGIKEGGKRYEFIEIMACPGGCVGGGGTPIIDSKTQSAIDVRKKRAAAIYEEDESLPVRKAHDSPVVKAVYKEFLGEPCSPKAREILHTHFVDRSKEEG